MSSVHKPQEFSTLAAPLSTYKWGERIYLWCMCGPPLELFAAIIIYIIYIYIWEGIQTRDSGKAAPPGICLKLSDCACLV